jgi:hypothetical protein
MAQMKAQPRVRVFWRAELSLLGLAILGLFLYLNAIKPKQEMLTETGPITTLSPNYGTVRNDDGKSRFLKIADKNDVFEVFIGHESGDFSPEMEKVDQLKYGDVVNIYYMETMIASSDKINRGVQFIDKAGYPYFIKGNTDKLWGLGIMGVSVFLMGILVVLKIKGLIG